MMCWILCEKDSEFSLREIERMTEDGKKIRLSYKEEDDILEVMFDGVEATSAIELTDNIILRFHRKEGRAAGLTLLDFSVLVSSTELGIRSFTLSGLDGLPADLRKMVVRLITTAPVNLFLKVATFYTSPGQQVPLTYVESPREFALAA